jgi:segregation and condensation protein B
VTRAKLSEILGKEVSRDLIASLRGEDLIAAGPRSPEPGAPYTYVTTKGFLMRFGFTSLNDLPDLDALEDAGLLGRPDGLDLLPNLAADREAENEEEPAGCAQPMDASNAD